MPARKPLMPDVLKVLILDVDVKYDLAAVTAALKHRYAGAQPAVITANSESVGARTIPSGRSFTETWRTLKSLGHEQFNYSAIPYRPRFLIRPGYLLRLLLLLVSGHGKRAFLLLSGDAGRLRSPLKALIFNPFWLWLWSPFISLAIIMMRPFYVVTQVFGKFILSREDPDDEFVGFGAGRTQGGLVYWLMIRKKAERNGLFGVALDTYMGVPVSTHNFPLVIFTLGWLGYRGLIYFSALLISAGIAWLCIASHAPLMLALIPIILFSTYFIQHISQGTWEPLSWGFSTLAFASLSQGLVLPAGFFLAATILSHLGVGLLTTLTLTCWLLWVKHAPVELIKLGLLTTLLTSWYLVPFLRSRDKLGRNTQINTLFKKSRLWPPERIYEFLIYSAFAAAMFWAGLGSLGALMMLLLPLPVLAINESGYWIFSPYTIKSYLMFSGAFVLCLHPAIVPFCIYLILIYTSPEVMYPGWEALWGDDLTPITLRDQRSQVRKLLSPLREGRIAFEHPRENIALWFVRAGLSYILAEEDIDLLNTSYAETGDARIYQKYASHFNAQAGPADFETACRESGVKYMVVLTDEFERLMTQRGYRELGRVDGLNLSPNRQHYITDLVLFELPWQVSVIAPETEVTIGRNEIRFTAEAGLSYLLKYSYYQGWQAFQNGRRLPLRDARPGMIVRTDAAGPVTLRYSYWHYWS